jgi:hypothetical protein
MLQLGGQNQYTASRGFGMPVVRGVGSIPSNVVNRTLASRHRIAAVAGAVRVEVTMHLAGAAVAPVHVEVGRALAQLVDTSGGHVLHLLLGRSRQSEGSEEGEGGEDLLGMHGVGVGWSLGKTVGVWGMCSSGG